MRKYLAIIALVAGVGLVYWRSGWNSSVAQSTPPTKSRTVATVNGDTIPLDAVDAVIKQRSYLQPPSVTQLRKIRMEVLTTLVDELLVRQYLRDHGPKIEPTAVDKQFTALEASLKAQKKTMEDYLQETNRTKEQVRADMLMLLQLDQYVKDHTTEADLQKYFTINKDYFEKTTVRTSHIVLRLSPDTPAADRAQTREKLQGLRGDIAAKKIEFAAAAKEHSQCPSAARGGDIGFIFRKWQEVDEAYARAAFGLKVGELSEVVETDFGFHLIKVTERKDGKSVKYEDCKDEVRDSYTEELRQALLAQLRKKAKIEITLP